MMGKKISHPTEASNLAAMRRIWIFEAVSRYAKVRESLLTGAMTTMHALQAITAFAGGNAHLCSIMIASFEPWYSHVFHIIDSTSGFEGTIKRKPLQTRVLKR